MTPIGAVWDDASAEDLGTRPGVYANFTSEAPPEPTPTSQGVVLVISSADWGPVNTSFDIFNRADVDRYLGTADSSRRTAVLDALRQGARKVTFYRAATGSAAKSSQTIQTSGASDALTVTALYEGTFGDQIKAEVVANPAGGGLLDLNIYVGTVKKETFTGTDNDSIVADYAEKGSKLVVVTKEGADDQVPATQSATALSGGNSGATLTSTEYNAALSAAQALQFSWLVLDTVDDALITSAATWVRNERNAGHLVRTLLAPDAADNFATTLAAAQGFDDEAVHYLYNGYTELGGTALAPVFATWGVAGLLASLSFASPTNKTLTGATAVSRTPSASEYATALTYGLLVLTYELSSVRIEQGLNTLQPSSQVSPKSPDWRKIRYVSVQDELVTRIGLKLKEDFIGKVPNSVAGRREAVRQIQTVLDGLVQDGALEAANEELGIEAPSAFIDPRYTSDGDKVYVGITGNFVDAAEKFFLSVSV